MPSLIVLALCSISSIAPAAWQQDYALRFDGAQLEFPHHPAMNTGDAFTAEAWVRASQPGIDAFKILDRYEASAEHKYLLLLPDGSIEYIYAGSPWPEVRSAPQAALLDGGWHHVAFVRRPNGDHASFLNGVQVAGGGPGRCWLTCGIINATPKTHVGSRETDFAYGWEIDELRISNVDRYWGTFTPAKNFQPDPSTVMLLHCDEGAGSQVADSSSYSQRGTLTGQWSWVPRNGPPGNYNWLENPTNGHFYALTAQQSWTSAAAEADLLGPEVELVTIRSQAENDWLFTTFSISSLPTTSGVWIGLSDAAAEGTWTWRSGEAVIYTNWAGGQPDDCGDEDFSHFFTTAGGAWNDGAFPGAPCFPGNEPMSAILEWIPPGLSLVKAGGCPGSVTLTVRGATPLATAIVVYGPSGVFTKLNQPCAGLTLAISPPSVGPFLPTDSTGSATLTFRAPAAVCGQTVQAVDFMRCLPSNPVTL